MLFNPLYSFGTSVLSLAWPQPMADSEKYLRLLSSFSRKLEDKMTGLLTKLECTEYTALDSFKSLIGPKKTLEQLSRFYSLYTVAIKNLEKFQAELEELLQSEKDGKEISPEKIVSLETFEKIEQLMKMKKDLEEFNGVKLVAAYEDKTTEYINRLMKIIKTSLFRSLKRLPKVPKDAPDCAHFILKHCENKEFLGEYTRHAYERLGLVGTEANKEIILQRTKNLTGYFNLVIRVNKEILGEKAAFNINVGLVTLIVLNFKKMIGEVLLAEDQNSDPNSIPFLVRLYKQLKHSPGLKIKEIETLFVFKPQIEKLIFNSFIQYFADLEHMDKPCKSLRAESATVSMAKILSTLDNAKQLKERWVASYGPSFGVYNVEDLNGNFSEKCLLKIQKLAKHLDNVPKSVYLINNYATLVNCTKTCGGRDIKQLINSNQRIIEGVWRIELDKIRKSPDLDAFLREQLTINSSYYLPKEQRLEICNELRKMVQNKIANSKLPGLSPAIIGMFAEIYKGV